MLMLLETVREQSSSSWRRNLMFNDSVVIDLRCKASGFGFSGLLSAPFSVTLSPAVAAWIRPATSMQASSCRSVPIGVAKDCYGTVHKPEVYIYIYQSQKPR